MKSRFAITPLLAVLLTASGLAHADYESRDSQMVRARVVASTPVTSRISEPHRECWTETEGYETRRVGSGSTGGAVIGAIAGGLLGSTVGKGDGRVAAAAVGAATGAVVGARVGGGNERYESEPRQVERCRVSEHQRVVVTGYDVRYSFEGREYMTRMPSRPGKWINLEVSHRVVDDAGDGDRYDDRDYRSSGSWDR